MTPGAARGMNPLSPVPDRGCAMKLAVLQLMLRDDGTAEHHALAEMVARAVARGADIVLPPEGIALDAASGLHTIDALGRTVTLAGDAAIDPAEHRLLLESPPDVLVLSPGAESDIQAEAVLELAIALSISLAGLVIVSERSGAEPGEPGHGGSAVILLGEVVAEAMSPDDLLLAEIPVPVTLPGPRAPLPEPSPILAQRLAHHRGERMTADYPADLM